MKPDTLPGLLFKNLYAKTLLPNRIGCCLHTSSIYMKGHSHYQNTKGEKEKLASQKSKLFSQFSREIINAVKESGADPKLNRKLADLISMASKVQYPKEKVKESINNALRKNEEGNESSVFMDGVCNWGFSFIVHGQAASKLRFNSEMGKIYKRLNLKTDEKKHVSYLFKKVGIVRVRLKESNDSTLEALKDHFSSLSFVYLTNFTDINFTTSPFEGNMVEMIFDFDAFYQQLDIFYGSEFDKTGLELINNKIEFIPTQLFDIDEQNLESCQKVIDALNEHPDVVNVYDNIKNLSTNTCKPESLFKD